MFTMQTLNPCCSIPKLHPGLVRAGLFLEVMSEHQHLVSLKNLKNSVAATVKQLWPIGSSGNLQHVHYVNIEHMLHYSPNPSHISQKILFLGVMSEHLHLVSLISQNNVAATVY